MKLRLKQIFLQRFMTQIKKINKKNNNKKKWQIKFVLALFKRILQILLDKLVNFLKIYSNLLLEQKHKWRSILMKSTKSKGFKLNNVKQVVKDNPKNLGNLLISRAKSIN